MQTLILSSFWNKLSLYLILGRFHRPIGIWLMLFPALWGLFLSTPSPFPLQETIWLVLGASLIRAAGCTYNDLVDREIDGKVRRTRGRPLAAQKLSFLEGTGAFLVFLSAAFGILLLFPAFTIWIGVSAVPLILLYPWLKRWTYWPQAFLGLAMNWGLLIGWTAQNGPLRPSVFFLLIAGICWTLGYDTLYAHQDKEDDQLIGVKSTALRLGKKTKPFLGFVYMLFLISFLVVGILEKMAWPFYVGLGFSAFSFYKQTFKTDLTQTASCLKAFQANQGVGLNILLGILGSQYLVPFLRLLSKG